jgi:Domain of unknown function (DUF6484)
MSDMEVDEAPPKLSRSDDTQPSPRGRTAAKPVDPSAQTQTSARRRIVQQGNVPSMDTVPRQLAAPISGVRVGVLIGLTDAGRTPLVIFQGQADSAAVAARATLDIHGAHIGRSVVLMFEDGDPRRPIIMGCLAPVESQAMDARLGQLEVETNGERLLITAKELLVLRCGKATITLTKAGKVLIQGTYISTRSSGVNRIKGGSVQLN